MKLSDKGLTFLTKEEGLRLKPYRDSVGLWTVGVGHLLTETELKTNVLNYPQYDLDKKPWRELNREDVLNLLRYDVERFEKCVNTNLPSDLKQHEFDALVSFSFNIGTPAFEKSTMLHMLKDGDKDIKNQFMRWIKPPELKGRRQRESDLFCSAKY